MSIKHELGKSISNVELTEKEKERIRYRVRHSNSTFKLSFKPILGGVFCVVIASVLLIGNLHPMNKDNSASKPVNFNESNQLSPKSSKDQNTEDTSQLLPKIPEDQITNEQKQQYYEEYKEIVEKAKKQAVGASFRLPSKSMFEKNGWVKPKDFEEMLQNNVDRYLSRKKEGRTWEPDPPVTKNGATTKSIIVYFPGFLKEIDVTAEFATQYNEKLEREVFESVDNVSTKFAFPKGEWKLTSVKPSLINDGKKYLIQIEGTWSYNSRTYEKIFTIEFHCDENGKIY